MKNEQTYGDIIEGRGVSLSMLGLRERALSRADALTAVDLLKAARTPILGGDVYFDRGGAVENAYSNWYVEKRLSESYAEFALRSCIESRAYISTFPGSPDATLLFVLVLSDGDS